MAGSALVYILLTGDLPPFVVVHRMISGIDSFPLLAVPFFILAGNLMNNAGHHHAHLQLCAGAGRLAARRPRARQRHRLDDLRRHVGHRHRRSGRARHDRDQGDEGPGLSGRVRRRRDGRIVDAGSDHSAVAAVRDLRNDGRRLGGPAVPRGHHARRGHGRPDDGDGQLLRLEVQVGRRHRVRMAARRQGDARARDRRRLSAGDLGCDSARTPRSIWRSLQACCCCWRPTGTSSSTRCCRS